MAEYKDNLLDFAESLDNQYHYLLNISKGNDPNFDVLYEAMEGVVEGVKNLGILDKFIKTEEEESLEHFYRIFKARLN